ncbi:MAG: hypothetical protein FJ091_13070 [Deltaproteobacteria bacterium]|nr:hypothetical protein [Deltaproteobacteria bacterium]
MYFLRRLRPLEVSGERVRALRVSLNTPVLATPDLPAAPGRAVIVVHRDTRGLMDATVGVRSQASGEIAYWSFDGELTSEDDLAVAADAALTFAESLGFIFDEGSLEGAEAGKAWRAWFAGEAPALSSGAKLFGGGSDELLGSDEMPELELGDLLLEPVEEGPRPGEPKPPFAPAAAPAKRMLSKFRAHDGPAAPRPARPPASAPAPAARKGPIRQPLAKLQLVKRRSPEEERKLLLRRLLTSF